jgi:hypothetical protein
MRWGVHERTPRRRLSTRRPRGAGTSLRQIRGGSVTHTRPVMSRARA